MSYCRTLEFEKEPDYEYLKGLMQQAAKNEDICMTDKMYDWCVKAMTIQCFPNFYNFNNYKRISPFNKKGRYTQVQLNNYEKNSKITEQ